MSPRFAARLATPLACMALGGLLFLSPAPAKALSLGGLFGSPVDAELAAQVPHGKRGDINIADFALACANQDIELAKLKEELADKRSDHASASTKLAKAQGRAAEIALDIAKMQGIMASGLGKTEDNRKIMDDLTKDRDKNAAELVQLKARVHQASLYVEDWTQRVAEKEKNVAEFKARRSGAGQAAGQAPASAPAAAKPATSETTADTIGGEPVVIVNKTPGAAPEPNPEAPESDLKN